MTMEDIKAFIQKDFRSCIFQAIDNKQSYD